MIKIILAIIVMFMILYVGNFINKSHKRAQRIERLYYDGRWKYILYIYYMFLILTIGILIILNL